MISGEVHSSMENLIVSQKSGNRQDGPKRADLEARSEVRLTCCDLVIDQKQVIVFSG